MLCDTSLWAVSGTQSYAKGTTLWMAPELLIGEQKTVSLPGDIFAFGITIAVNYIPSTLHHCSSIYILNGRKYFGCN
jgi:serine/threonine protein kinase